MALQPCGVQFYPSRSRLLAATGVSSSANYQINGSGQRIGWVFQVPKSGTVNKLGVRIATAATPILSRIGLYTVDGSGNPTTSAYGSGAYETFTPAANTYSEITIGSSVGTPYTMTARDICALVVEFDSTAGDYFLSAASGGSDPISFPYFDKFNGVSTWTKSTTGVYAFASLAYNDGTYGDIGAVGFADTGTSSTYNLNSTPDEYALNFTAPFKCRAIGAWSCFNPASTGDFELDLYSGTSQIATTGTVDGDDSASANNYRQYLFSSPVTLAAGSSYYVSQRPLTTANNNYRYANLVSANMVQGLGFFPTTLGLATRTDLGSWGATDNTKIPYLGIVFDQLDDGASGSNIFVFNSEGGL